MADTKPKTDKLKEILKWVKIGTGVAKVVVPGGAGNILDIINKNIADDSDPTNEGSLKVLAEVNDQQTEAILALHKRISALEAKK